METTPEESTDGGPIKKPFPDHRDTLAGGLLDGLGAVAAGFGQGAVALAAGPVIGAQKGGMTGAVVGLTAGVAGAVVLPIVGLVSGAVKVVASAANTPSAFKAAAQGKEWDEIKQQYDEYSLDEEVERVRAYCCRTDYTRSTDTAAHPGMLPHHACV